jgi:hypothetical protein
VYRIALMCGALSVPEDVGSAVQLASEDVAVHLRIVGPLREVDIVAQRLRHFLERTSVVEELLGPVFEAVEVALVGLLEALDSGGHVVGGVRRPDMAEVVGEDGAVLWMAATSAQASSKSHAKSSKR